MSDVDSLKYVIEHIKLLRENFELIGQTFEIKRYLEKMELSGELDRYRQIALEFVTSAQLKAGESLGYLRRCQEKVGGLLDEYTENNS